jgi:uncharacterized repeat protein (TIGR03843 family)
MNKLGLEKNSEEINILGRLVDASNATLFGEILCGDDLVKVIYKPIAGERPLWDFPDGSLAFREYSAFLLSEACQFNIVPTTILRDGPFGFGMVQQWIDVDKSIDLIGFGQSDNPQLRKLALFDSIINNTDRKYGHLLLDTSNHLYGCDHGVSFHKEDKLRTVIWQFAGRKFTSDEIELLDRCLELDLTTMFEDFLNSDEIDSLSYRIKRLKKENCFPFPSDQWPAIPWPPV